MKVNRSDLDQTCINAIRVLTIDAVQKANSGHCGLPMGMAPAAYLLYTRFMRHNPKNPKWFGRDRFVLSAGHGSMLLYSLLYLTGYDLGLDDIKQFRQLGSRTPGHPEHGLTPGVETTTGPLGPGHRQHGRHGDGGEASRGALRARQFRPVRSSHLRHLRRRRPDGRRRERGGVDSRPRRPGQHRSSLRRQPRDDRRAHRAQLRRGRGQTLRRVQMAHAGCRRRERSRGAVEGHRKWNRGDQPPVADSRALDHRLRQPAQAGHLGRAQQSARRRRGETHQGILQVSD